MDNYNEDEGFIGENEAPPGRNSMLDLIPRDLVSEIYSDKELGEAIADFVNDEYLSALVNLEPQAEITKEIEAAIYHGKWDVLKSRLDFLVLTTSLSKLVGKYPLSEE